ncbi:MAG: type II toxin-antitoxin system PemK/MazF family toxin [Acidimicrobiia bacterium]|nr:type II toxin-antitoxin system PemK/MazF family toxin [Acidimicrobiia bacterium]
MASVDDLWLVDFGVPYPGEPATRRPALVVGPPEIFGPAFPFIIVVPLTTARRGLSLHIEVEASAATGLERTSYVQCELLRSVNRNRLVHRLGGIDSATSLKVAAVIGTLLGR